MTFLIRKYVLRILPLKMKLVSALWWINNVIQTNRFVLQCFVT